MRGSDTPEPLLVGIPYSPWTERARWALDHHGIAYRFQSYLPILGEIRLRMRLREAKAKVTVPVLFAGDEVVRDSLDIVRWADRRGGADALIPRELEAQVLAWDDRAEAAFDAGRSLYVARMLRDPELLDEMAPRALPRAFRGPAARVGVALFRRKYGLVDRSGADEATLAGALDALRDGLRGDREHVLDRFTLADVAMAISLHHVKPVSEEYLRMTPAARRCAAQPGFAERYADLVAWRDATYARHRRSRAHGRTATTATA